MKNVTLAVTVCVAGKYRFCRRYLPGPQLGSTSGQYMTIPRHDAGESSRHEPVSISFKKVLVLSSIDVCGKPVGVWLAVRERVNDWLAVCDLVDVADAVVEAVREIEAVSVLLGEIDVVEDAVCVILAVRDGVCDGVDDELGLCVWDRDGDGSTLPVVDGDCDNDAVAERVSEGVIDAVPDPDTLCVAVRL